MKRFYKFLMPLVAIVAMALPVNIAAQTSCQIKIVGEDEYADGWNGGSLAVVQNGATLATFDAANADNDGEGPELDSTTVTISNAPVSFVWTSGLYDYEVTIWIYHSSGVLLYTVTNPTAGTLFTLNSPCSGCFAPSNVHLDTSEGIKGGRITTLHHTPQPIGENQPRERRPLPRVCSSATTTKPSAHP